MSLNIVCSATKPTELLRDHLLAVPIGSAGGKLPSWVRDFPYDLRAALESASRGAGFGGKVGETLLVPSGFGVALLAGTGATAPTLESLRRIHGSIFSAARRGKFAKVATPLLPGRDSQAIAEATVTGAWLANYRFDAFRSDTTRDRIPVQVSGLTIFEPDGARRKAAVKGIEVGAIAAEAVTRVRDAANMPANALTPKSYAELASEWCQGAGVKLQILGPREIDRAGMGCVMAVASGSANEPRFLVATYLGNQRQKKRVDIALVGKGVTFDTGGISIKPWQDMWEMRGDMAGSAVMLASICAAAKMKLATNIVTLTPLVENMPSGTAYRPGDVLKSLSGQTIEINSTDAEGRLILADALTYAQRFDPRLIIDMATLTGAIRIALGDVYCGIFTNSEELSRIAQTSATQTGEKAWRMPLHEAYEDKLACVVADMRNSADRYGGASIAAGFLRKFTGGYPWLHIDIAGVDLEPKGHPYCPKGASGFGARLVIDMLRQQAMTRFVVSSWVKAAKKRAR